MNAKTNTALTTMCRSLQSEDVDYLTEITAISNACPSETVRNERRSQNELRLRFKLFSFVHG